MSIIKRILLECKFIKKQKWTYEDVGRYWDEITDYDAINKRAYSYFRRFSDALKLCSIADKSNVLDICSRTGNNTAYFYLNGKISHAVCADVTSKMLNTCSINLKKHRVNFKTVLFNRLPLPLPDDEFDAVLCFETIEHMPEPEKFIGELARVLKPRGELLLTTPNILWELGHRFVAIFNLHHSEGPHKFLPRRYILQIAKKVGFLLEKEKTTVLVPGGIKFFTDFGEFFENLLPERLLRLIALRRIFIFRRPANE